MKCPKCGYNSFEIHDSCKKCANDLTGYKNTHGLKSVVLPLEARASMAEKLRSESSQDVPVAVAAAPTDMFSFDIPEDRAEAGRPSVQDDPFSFDDTPASPALGGGEFSFSEEQKSAQARAEEAAFADLLESSAQSSSEAAASATVVEDQEDLNNFSWDDTPVASGGAEVPPSDDFNSLFGDTDEDTKK